MGWNKYTGPAGFSGGESVAQDAANQVTQVMAQMASTASSFTASATSTIDQLSNIVINDPGDAPEVKLDRANVTLQWPEPEPIDTESLEAIAGEVPEAPETPSIDTKYDVVRREFTPSFDSINIPNAPLFSDLPLPEYAQSEMPAFPDAPALIPITSPELTELVLPEFTPIAIPTFDELAPSYDAAQPNTVVNWAEPTYAPEVLDEVMLAVKMMLAGGMPPAIQAMFDSARGREDMTARKAVVEAFDTFANKGFTMPSGMLAAQVNAAMEQNQLQANSLQRDLTIKAVDVQIENMRTALVQGIAAENVLANIFNNAQDRAFQVAKYVVQAAVEMYNAQVSAFNAVMNGYQVRAGVYKTRVDAALASLEAYKIAMDGKKIEGEINVQRVQAYSALVQAQSYEVERYKAQMGGVEIQAKIIATQAEAYRSEVMGYAETINAQRSRVEVFRATVEGEVAKSNIHEAPARTFVALVQADRVQADAFLKGVDAQIEVAKLENSGFLAELERSKAMVSANLSRVQAAARVQELKIQNMSAQSEANRGKALADIQLTEMQLQSNLSAINAAIKKYEVAVSKAIQEADLRSKAMQSAGQIASTLAGGAMAAQHVSAQISGTGSESFGLNYGFNQQAQEVWQYAPPIA